MFNEDAHYELMADYDRFDGFPRGDEMQDWMDMIDCGDGEYVAEETVCEDSEDVPF